MIEPKPSKLMALLGHGARYQVIEVGSPSYDVEEKHSATRMLPVERRHPPISCLLSTEADRALLAAEIHRPPVWPTNMPGHRAPIAPASFPYFEEIVETQGPRQCTPSFPSEPRRRTTALDWSSQYQ